MEKPRKIMISIKTDDLELVRSKPGEYTQILFRATEGIAGWLENAIMDTPTSDFEHCHSSLEGILADDVSIEVIIPSESAKDSNG